jgi:hypothetical protein
MEPDRTTAALLEVRYGRRDSDRRILAVVLALGVLLVGFLTWSTLIGTSTPISARLVTYTLDSDVRTTVTFMVRTDERAQGPFTCVLRAQGEQRIDVGYALVSIAPTAGAERTLSYPLTTRAPARIVEVLGCGAGLDRPIDVPAPQFPPGVRPPEQVAPGRAP